MAPLDLDEAERLIASIRRERDRDHVAQAYDILVAFLVNNNRDTREMIGRAAAVQLFAEITSAFPAQSNEQDVSYLLEAGSFRSASAAKRLEDSKTAHPSAAVAMLRSIDPELLERYKSEREELAQVMTAEDAPKPEEEHKDDVHLPDLSEMSYSDALSYARKLENPTERNGCADRHLPPRDHYGAAEIERSFRSVDCVHRCLLQTTGSQLWR
jgi:hypothetical protein